jgi:hypothetical protein
MYNQYEEHEYHVLNTKIFDWGQSKGDRIIIALCTTLKQKKQFLFYL